MLAARAAPRPVTVVLERPSVPVSGAAPSNKERLASIHSCTVGTSTLCLFRAAGGTVPGRATVL
jgi:hypothetical protein